MAKSTINVIKKPRGRPATGKGVLVGVRLQPDRLRALDKWIKDQGGSATRPEAIRAILDTVLVILQHNRPKNGKRNPSQKARANELAGGAIDKLTDAKAAPDDQANRKRRLLKGPEEFREARAGRAKRKD